MSLFRPKYISFDCYGTLTRFRMSEMAAEFMADRLAPSDIAAFCTDWSYYRFDQVLGPWEPYREVLRASLRRTCSIWNVEYREQDADFAYTAIPSWGPHEDVPSGLSKIADKIPLVILSNAMNEHINDNVAMLGAPFHAIYTAEMANAYKPRVIAFDHMFQQLGCGPEEMMHVSSSFRYDLHSASFLKFGCRVFVGRNHEPSNNFYRDVEIPHIGALPAVVGL